MKSKILTILLCLISLSVMGQTNGTVTRKKKQQTTTTTSSGKQEQKKKQTSGNSGKNTSSANSAKKESKPVQTTPKEEAGYDVTFSCNVSSATLFIDGINQGSISKSYFLKTGNHSIRLSANGYEDFSQNIEVNRENTSFTFNMIKKTEPKPEPKVESVQPIKPEVEPRKELKYTTNQTFTANGVSFTMVYVEGGTFTMGATSEQGSDAWTNEKPAHSVTLSNYMIGQTEVTQELWQTVMGNNPSKFKGRNLPVEQVSWNDCQIFIRKLNSLTGQNFRLPTEAEWEYACRGGKKSKGYRYSGSDNIRKVAWFDGKMTHPVGQKQANELGIYDMSGNVWEWCQDYFESYSSSSQTNPTGPSSGSDRVNRGGGWFNSDGRCRSSHRGFTTPSVSYNILGLRLAL